MKVNKEKIMALVTMNINGQEVKAEAREPILKAIRAQGIKVPTLCHMDGLEPYGVCRMCVVQIKRGKRTKLVTSCNFPAAEGLEILTDTEEVLQHRRMMAELLLARAPEVKKVQEIAASLGVEKSRFKTVGKPSNCLLCGLCVRVCDEIVGASALGFIGRGNERVVGTPWYVNPDSCIACGACTYVCPTGAMQMETITKERWQKELGGDQRTCRYARMGLISNKVCPNNFNCNTCEVDQQLFDEFGTHPILALAPGLNRQPKKVGHFSLIEDRNYFQGHTWAKTSKEHTRVGLDDFAQKIIGGVSRAAFSAKPGDVVRRGDPALNVSNNGHSATMLFPVSGKIIHINPVLEDNPSLINEDCYDRGWLYMIKPTNSYEEKSSLIGPDEADQWTQDESDRLFSVLSDSKSAALSDGGELLHNFSRNLEEKDWERVTNSFFSGGK
ncbi:MAG: 2Fe-2S iron-sulfur cluster-binding protein [candidate division Zixibacteria bacterium]|nr:2Fe-2S iron-sulfur cluster-binding protein [candidate division Zixibacteria bacterium]